jgi:hypothetical protein
MYLRTGRKTSKQEYKRNACLSPDESMLDLVIDRHLVFIQTKCFSERHKLVGMPRSDRFLSYPQVHGLHSHGSQVHELPCACEVSTLTVLGCCATTLSPHVHGLQEQEGPQEHEPLCVLEVSTLTVFSGNAVAIMRVSPSNTE